MADIFTVADIVDKIASGFEEKVMSILEDNRDMAANAVRDQLYSGLDGDGQPLNPTYLTDPYFEDVDPKSQWYRNGEGYMKWKRRITPPAAGVWIDTPQRPPDVPNLYIDGTFHSEIFAQRKGDVLSVDVKEEGNGPAIVEKYGASILKIGEAGIEHFSANILSPGIADFLESCGW